MNDISKILDGITNLTKDGIPIKTDNSFRFDTAQLFYLIGGMILSAFVVGISISAGNKIFK